MNEKIEKELSAIAKGKVAPAYVISGDEEYLVVQAEKAISEALVAEADRAFNLVVFDDLVNGWNEVVSNLKTLPMFGARKVVVVHLGGGGDSSRILELARKSWKEGDESQKLKAVRYLTRLLGYADWPLEALLKSGPDAHSIDEWKQKIEVTRITRDDLDWFEDAYSLATKHDIAPASESDDEAIVSYIGSKSDSDSVLIISGKINKGKKIYKTIAKVGIAIDFPAPKGEKLQRGALKEEIDDLLLKSGKKLGADAYARLERKTGFNLRVAAAELAKIITYVGERKEITAEDIEAVVPQTKEESVFELTDAIGERDLSKSLRLVNELLGQKHFPLEILGAIHREVRNLYLATDYARGTGRVKFERGMFYGNFQKNVLPKIVEKQGRISKLHPFVIFKALEHQDNFDRFDLEEAFEAIGRADLKLKSTRADPRFVLEEVVFNICTSRR